MTESRRDRFKRIAGTRTNKILDMIKLLGNCANTGNYEYTDDDVKKIFSTIDREIKNAKAKFNGSEAQKNNRFTLN